MSDILINPLEPEKAIEHLSRSLLLAKGTPEEKDWGRAIFLIGAGCSQSTGIPMAGGVSQLCLPKLVNSYSQSKEDIKEPKKAFEWLCNNGHLDKSKWSEDPDWAKLYGELFANHFKSDGQQREIILDAINKGGDKINWAHLCLGELVSRGFVHTVLTTNFDQLVLRGIINTGVIPVVADGLEALSRVISNSKTPQVVHLHGSMHTYNLRNSKKDIEETEAIFNYVGMMHGLLQNCDVLVIIGYSGGEEGIMKLLKKAATSFPNIVVYWIMYENYEKDPEKLSDNAKELLSIGHNKFLITNYDADKFFIDILEELKIGVPKWMKNPVEILIDESELIVGPKNDDITKKIDEYKNKLSLLNNFWNEPTEETNDNLAEISTLRLEGEFEKAFLKLKSIDKKNYELWKMQAEIAFEAGRQKSNLDFLEESKNAWQEAIKLAQDDHIAFYKAQLGLAKTLQLFYELEESKIEYINKSVEAYRAALNTAEFKENNIENWAETQNDLGVALQTIYESDANLIQEAIDAFENALQQFTQDKDPKRWAETKSNLGGALQRLGELNKDTDLMERAKTEFESALEVYTYERLPKDWAETQMNLGSVLQKIGEIKKDTSLLEKAGKAYNRALKVYNSKKSDNWLWAMSSFGKVLQTLGELQSNASFLQDAKVVYQEILNVYDNNVDLTEEPFKSITEWLTIVETKISALEK